jgi:hypothetical protein
MRKCGDIFTASRLQMTIWRMRIKYWITEATFTHSDYVIVCFVCLFVWGPVSGCTAACRLIVHTPCVFNVPRHNDAGDPSSERWNLLGEKCPVIWPIVASSTLLSGSFTCRKSTTWDRRLYFLSEGSRAEDFFALKYPTASAGFEPANLGTKSQHATPRPPNPLRL